MEWIIALAKLVYSAQQQRDENKRRAAEYASILRENNLSLAQMVGAQIRAILAERDLAELRNVIESLATFARNAAASSDEAPLKWIIRDAEYAINLSLRENAPDIRKQAVLSFLALASLRLNAMVLLGTAQPANAGWISAARTDASRYVARARETHEKLRNAARARATSVTYSERTWTPPRNSTMGDVPSYCKCESWYWADGSRESRRYIKEGDSREKCRQVEQELFSASDQERVGRIEGFLDALPNRVIEECIHSWNVFAAGGTIRERVVLQGSNGNYVRIHESRLIPDQPTTETVDTFLLVEDAKKHVFLRAELGAYVEWVNEHLEVRPRRLGTQLSLPEPSWNMTFAVSGDAESRCTLRLKPSDGAKEDDSPEALVAISRPIDA